jgi:DNA-binding CsgD family transcriptional regulator
MSNLTPNGGGRAHRFIVGRSRELGVFRAAFSQMLGGRRQVMLISGEPGIGKTRCAEALADEAEDQGALVLWGRCHEEAGAPPYWAWVQILRAYVDASSLDEVRLNMGVAANDIAALVPDLLGVHPDGDQISGGIVDANAARFRTFDAIRLFLNKAAQQVPIALILDNLHWADALSLSLLEFLSQELLRSRLFVVATYRDADATIKTPLQSTLGALGRDSDVARVHLKGLSHREIGEVAEQLCGVSLSKSSIDVIYRRTDGNPLFVIELIKVLLEEGDSIDLAMRPAGIPAGVREAIGRRLVRLSDRCNELLCAAAVYGRQFTARELGAVLQEDVQGVLIGLEPAVRAGIVQTNIEAPGSYQFTHDLIRETIYEDLPTLDRLHLHGRAGDALVSIHTGHPECAVTRIAHHYHEAVTLGNIEKAVIFALRAADSAVRMYAYEDALSHYDRVIGNLETAGLVNDEQLARAYILKGAALRMLGQSDRSLETLLKAVGRIRILGDAEMLVDVLTFLAFSTQHVAQQHLIPLLDHALAALPNDSVARAKALATLAFAQRTLAHTARVRHLVDEALDIASRCADATARCACFQLTIMALRGNPETLHRRLLLGLEYVTLAQSTNSSGLLVEAYYWQALNYCEAGRIADLEVLLEHYESLSTARFGLHQYWAAAYRVTLALLRGEWTDLEHRIEQLLKLGTQTRRDDADGVFGAQMFALNRDLGRLHALVPQIAQITGIAGQRMWEPGLMLLCGEVGLLAEARRIFDRLVERDCGAMARDDMYLTGLVFCAETCCTLGDVQRAESLYRLLHPYTGQAANHPTAVCFGAADLYLAMLACTANWPDLARQHFEQALALNRAMRAWPYLARTLFRYGAFLTKRQNDEDLRLGRQLLRDAEHMARRFGMTRLVIDVDALLHAKEGSATYPDGLTAREVEVLRLLAIGRTNKDVALVLSISLNTVATHVRSILSKTQCSNRTEAATYAIRQGLQGAQSESSSI